MGKRGNGEGTIYQRDGSWVASYTDSAGKRRELWGKTRGAVAERLTAALRARDKGELAVVARGTVALPSRGPITPSTEELGSVRSSTIVDTISAAAGLLFARD